MCGEKSFCRIIASYRRIRIVSCLLRGCIPFFISDLYFASLQHFQPRERTRKKSDCGFFSSVKKMEKRTRGLNCVRWGRGAEWDQKGHRENQFCKPQRQQSRASTFFLPSLRAEKLNNFFYALQFSVFL